MYVPMGGRSTRILNIWLIFLFVAIWHDIEMKLLAWGMLNALFYVLEVIGSFCMQSKFVQKNLSQNAITYIGIFSGATYIIILIGVNMLGYSMLGTDGTSLIFGKLLCYQGFKTLVVCYYFLVTGVNIMRDIQEIRQENTPTSNSNNGIKKD